MSQFTDGSTRSIPESSPTFPVSRSDENHAQIRSDTHGKLDWEVGGAQVHVPRYTKLRYQI